MKRIVVSGISILLLSFAVPAAQAQSSASSSADSAIVSSATPFDLVSLAYQGFLESQGIPKFNRLSSSYRTGRTTAEDLVQAAIDTRRLPADTINNRRYLRAVERHLDSLSNNSN